MIAKALFWDVFLYSIFVFPFSKVTKSGRASYYVSYMRETFKQMQLPKYCLPKVSSRKTTQTLMRFISS